MPVQVILVLEDGAIRNVNPKMTLASFVALLSRTPVESIVIQDQGQTPQQFAAATVMETAIGSTTG